MTATMKATRPVFGEPRDMRRVTYEPEPRSWAEAKEQLARLINHHDAVTTDAARSAVVPRILDLVEMMTGESYQGDSSLELRPFSELRAAIFGIVRGHSEFLAEQFIADCWPDPPSGAVLNYHPESDPLPYGARLLEETVR